MKLIDKDALVAEIDKRLHQLTDAAFDSMIGRNLIEIRDFLDTLEVKEVDLEKEINEYICNNFFGSQTLGFFANRTKEEPNDQDIVLCAKHFFELGLKTQKGRIV